MRTCESDSLIERTNSESALSESDAVWEQLLRLAEGGDIRAIKLYYEMLEKKQRSASAGGVSFHVEPMAAIRRAVFGDAAVDAAARDAAFCRGMAVEAVEAAEDEEDVDAG